MYAVGGTGEFSEWKAVKTSLNGFGKGKLSQAKSSELVLLINGIEHVRGNGSALSGVYTVYALQMLADGNSKNAGYAIGVLEKEYVSQALFARLWDRTSLTEECKECASKSSWTKCSSCNGTGRSSSGENKLKNSRKVKRLGSERKCFSCNGTGKVKSNTASCMLCGGSGRVLSKDKVRENLKTALRRTKILVNLKYVQCALSLRPLVSRWGDNSETNSY